MGHASFDAFRNELFVRGASLAVAVFASLAHGSQRAHAAVNLVRTTLVQHEIAWSLVGARKERPDHYAGSPRRDRFGDIARVLDPAIGDDGHVVTLRDRGALVNGGNLRHADARHDARGADGSRPDSDFGIGARFDERLGGLRRGTLPAMTSMFG